MIGSIMKLPMTHRNNSSPLSSKWTFSLFQKKFLFTRTSTTRSGTGTTGTNISSINENYKIQGYIIHRRVRQTTIGKFDNDGNTV
jgi:hypothetical protein